MRTLASYARLEPSQHHQKMLVMLGELLGTECRRKPELFVGDGEVHVPRHDPDDGSRPPIHPNLAAHDAGIGAESSTPEAVAQNDDVIAARPGLFLAEGASHRWSHAERGKEIEADQGRADVLRRVFHGEIDARPLKRHQVLKHLIVALHICPIAYREDPGLPR